MKNLISLLFMLSLVSCNLVEESEPTTTSKDKSKKESKTKNETVTRQVVYSLEDRPNCNKKHFGAVSLNPVDDSFEVCNGKEYVTLQGKDGANGENGLNGQDGTNGEDGLNGKDGADGENGLNGKDGADGENGLNGKDGADGEDGLNGKDGADGQDGIDGLNAEDIVVILEEEDEETFECSNDLDGKVILFRNSNSVYMCNEEVLIPIVVNEESSGVCNESNMLADSFAGGLGTELSPYLICTADQLIHIDSLMEGNVDGTEIDAHFKLLQDIDMDGAILSGALLQRRSYTGTFDGNGFAIKYFQVESEDSHAAFMDLVYTGGVIKNLTFSDSSIIQLTINGHNAATVTKNNYGLIKNVHVINGHVSGNRFSGGLVGQNRGGIIEESSADVIIDGTEYSGGLAATNEMNGIIRTSKSTGVINGRKSAGLVASSYANVSDCYSHINLYGQDNATIIYSLSGGSYNRIYTSGRLNNHFSFSFAFGRGNAQQKEHVFSTPTPEYFYGTGSGQAIMEFESVWKSEGESSYPQLFWEQEL